MELLTEDGKTFVKMSREEFLAISKVFTVRSPESTLHDYHANGTRAVTYTYTIHYDGKKHIRDKSILSQLREIEELL